MVDESPSEAARETGESVYRGLVSVAATGIAIIVPLVVTVWVLSAIIDVLAGAFAPVAATLEWLGVVAVVRTLWVDALGLAIPPGAFDLLADLVAVAVLAAAILAVGTLAHVRYGERVVASVDAALADVPGVGAIYRSFRRVGDAMIDRDADDFEDVKVVEYPRDGSYVLGFETASSPDAIADAVGEDDLVAVFLPFAPNPVMGGYLAHIPAERVHDVDMTVEEGIRTIVTSGIAAGEDGDDLPVDTVRDVNRENPANAD